MIKAIKLAKINGVDYYYHPLDQKQNNYLELERQFLKTDLNWVLNLDFDTIVFYNQDFKNWWNKIWDQKKSHYLYKAKQLDQQAKIDRQSACLIFAKLGCDFNDFQTLNWKQFCKIIPNHKIKHDVILGQKLRWFKNYYQVEIDQQVELVIDPQLDHDLVKTKLLAAQAAIATQGLIPIFIFLQGAHNYGLADQDSDYDFKALVISNDLFEHDFKVATISYNNKINELVDCKSWILFKQLLSQFHYPYLEILKTKAFLINRHFWPFWNDLNKLLKASLINNEYLIKRSIIDQMSNKLAALNKPFPSKIAVIKTFGYDPKQAHHYFRLKTVLDTIDAQGVKINSLWPQYNELEKLNLIAIKRNGLKTWINDADFIKSQQKQLMEDFEKTIVKKWRQMSENQHKKALILAMEKQLQPCEQSFFKCLYQQVKISNRFNKNKKNNHNGC